MKDTNELRLDIAKYLFEDWKNLARGLLVGGHLSDSKRRQYDMGMVKWHMLEPMYQEAYLRRADEILQHCACNLDTLAHICFNETGG